MPVEVIAKIKPKNNADFKIADQTDIEGSIEGNSSLQDDITFLKNKISEAGSSLIHIGPDEPANKNAIWVDESDVSSADALQRQVNAGDSLIVQTYEDAIQNIKDKVEEVSYALNKEIEPGGFQIRTVSGAYVDDTDSSTSNPALDSNFYPEVPNEEEDIFIPTLGSSGETEQYENDLYIGKSNVNTVRVKRGTKYNLPILKDGEFGFCKDTGELYIGNINSTGYSLTKIGSSGTGGDTSGGNLAGDYLDLQSNNGTAYRVKITDSGLLTVLPKSLYELPAVNPEDSGILGTDYVGLVINQMYGGGAVYGSLGAPEKGYVSHSFVELYNGSLTGKDLSLEGLSIQYKGPSGGWQMLALHGVIPYRHSFLIRGLQHFGIGPDEFTRLEITKYDMQWNLAFSDKGFSIYLGAGTTPLAVENPYNIDGKGTKQEGYIDLVGVGGKNPTETVTAYEERYWHFMDNQTAALRIDHFDRINTDLKPFSSRNTVMSLDYSNINIESFRPRYLAYGEWDSQEQKLRLNPNAPSSINITFGYDGNTSRCFNWQTTQSDQGSIFYRKLGETKWTEKESTKNHVKLHDGMCTVHKVLIKDLQPGTTYEYKCGYDGHYSDVFWFDVIDYDFSPNPAEGKKDTMEILWTSDQQGWTEYDYTMWRAAFDEINKVETYDFLINTGDVSENGSRPFEWRYWYRYTPETKNYCNQIANGNNDLGGPQVDDGTPISYYMYNENEHPRVYGCYSFNVGEAHFLVISSNHKDITAYPYYRAQGVTKPSYKDMFKDEMEWAREDLTKPENASKRWCFIMLHASPISCYRMGQQQLLLEIIEEFHVHFVFCGHNHTYSRSLPITNVPIDTGLVLKEQTGTEPFYDSSIPADVTDPRSYYTDWEKGTVYVMCQSTGCKLEGKYGQMRGAWWYDWAGPHPYAPSYIKINLNHDKIEFKSYKINEIVPTANDKNEFYTTPPIPVGPERYMGNPIYGGTSPAPTPVNIECIDYASDDFYARTEDTALNGLKALGARKSYEWRPWGRNLENGHDK